MSQKLRVIGSGKTIIDKNNIYQFTMLLVNNNGEEKSLCLFFKLNNNESLKVR